MAFLDRTIYLIQHRTKGNPMPSNISFSMTIDALKAREKTTKTGKANMTNKSKNKGSNEERAVVNLLREHGFTCQRTLEAGARPDGSNTWDIDLYARGIDRAPLIGECKIRASGYKTLYDQLGENDFLTVRADRKPRLWVFREEVAIELFKGLRNE